MEAQTKVDQLGALKRIDGCMRAGILYWDQNISIDVHVELAMFAAVGLIPDDTASVEFALQLLTDESEPEETDELQVARQLLTTIC